MLLTFLLVTVGWVIFRSPSIGFAFNYFGGLFGSGQSLSFAANDFFYLPAALLLMLVVEWLNRGSAHEFARHPRFRVVRWMGYMLLISIMVCYMQTSEMPFIYFQF